MVKTGDSVPVDLLAVRRPITKKELAEWTGFTERFIDQEVLEGNLRKRFSGRASRFMADDIREWFNRRSSDNLKHKRAGKGLGVSG
jgi:predicted DNA-binding transcriptional regulator AlpA